MLNPLRICYGYYLKKINPEYARKQKSQYINNKKLVLEMLGGAKCVNCGCDVFEFLEVNHKNGGGYKEQKETKCNNVVNRVIYKHRKIDDLEVTCHVCNHLHYLIRKNPKQAKGFKIFWTKIETT